MLRTTVFFSLFTAAAAALGVSPPQAAGAVPEGELRLSLNLPSYELEVWRGEERIRAYPVTIGKPSHPTPTGGYRVTRIEWNPWWNPPPSPWAEGKEKAAPGPDNPMGRVKLQFGTYLYVHGTSNEAHIGGPHSHGCVRLRNEDALELARLVAKSAGVLSEDEIDALERNPGRTHSVPLADPVPLRIRYGLHEESGGEILELEDPYGWAGSSEARAPGAPGAAFPLASALQGGPARGRTGRGRSAGDRPRGRTPGMNARSYGPQVLPPAAAARKRMEEILDTLPAWDREPRDRDGEAASGTDRPDAADRPT